MERVNERRHFTQWNWCKERRSRSDGKESALGYPEDVLDWEIDLSGAKAIGGYHGVIQALCECKRKDFQTSKCSLNATIRDQSKRDYEISFYFLN